MNNDRRKRLADLIKVVEELREALEAIKEEEQEAFDNMPEGLQHSERGEASQAAIDSMDYAGASLESVTDALQEASQ